ncbi:MAG: glycosyltransferase, partial [Desulfobacteraceae bacterium]|nr:glycosyltransferase [Desulfobacteraceae bacterium]
REDVPKLLKLAHCFVLASHSEGLSCSIIEAMAAGLPVVATDVGGNCELVNNGVNGYLLPPNDPGAFAEKLHILINDDEKRQKFGKNSSKIANDKFSLDKMIAEYVSVYRELLHTT